MRSPKRVQDSASKKENRVVSPRRESEPGGRSGVCSYGFSRMGEVPWDQPAVRASDPQVGGREISLEQDLLPQILFDANSFSQVRDQGPEITAG